MNKKEIIDVVHRKTGYTKIETKAIVDAVFDGMFDAMSDGDEIRIAGFGTLLVVERSQRKMKNPRTGEDIIVEARNTVKFKPAKALKTAVN